jgi:hypothetical protein
MQQHKINTTNDETNFLCNNESKHLKEKHERERERERSKTKSLGSERLVKKKNLAEF